MFDSCACIPIFLYEASYGFTTDEAEKERQIESNVYNVFVFFKLFKLLMISRINRSINLIQDQLKEIFVQDKITVENMFGYMKAAFTFLILIHFFACVWLYTGAIEGEWMTEE